jgi:protein-S-isoprenylcysteine O-methyltransferase
MQRGDPAISSPLPASPASPFPPRPSASMTAAPAPSPLRALLHPTRTSSIPAHLAPSCFRIVLLAAALGALAGVALPHALALFAPSTLARAVLVLPRGASAATMWPPQLAMYLAAWAIFHLLEFEITAGWNGTRLMEDCECTRPERSHRGQEADAAAAEQDSIAHR